jgi:hypothetical protein
MLPLYRKFPDAHLGIPGTKTAAIIASGHRESGIASPAPTDTDWLVPWGNIARCGYRLTPRGSPDFNLVGHAHWTGCETPRTLNWDITRWRLEQGNGVTSCPSHNAGLSSHIARRCGLETPRPSSYRMTRLRSRYYSSDDTCRPYLSKSTQNETNVVRSVKCVYVT